MKTETIDINGEPRKPDGWMWVPVGMVEVVALKIEIRRLRNIGPNYTLSEITLLRQGSTEHLGRWMIPAPPIDAEVDRRTDATVIAFRKPIERRDLEIHELNPPPPIARRGVWPGTYADYLRTPQFRQIAAAAKKEWRYRCLLDARHGGPVEMHHRSYAGVPFGEDWRDLIPLCAACHRQFHQRLQQPPQGLFTEVETLKKAA